MPAGALRSKWLAAAALALGAGRAGGGAAWAAAAPPAADLQGLVSDAETTHGAEPAHGNDAHGTEHTPHGSETGEAHGEGHGESHGEGHGDGHHPVSLEVRDISCLMLVSVGVLMFFLYFLNYSDPDVRCASSKMVCTAVSVYIAVLVNQALFSFIFEQLLVGKKFGLGINHDAIKPWMRGMIGALIFVLTLFSLNLICWRMRSLPNRLVAFSQLGAHMVAWAGINAFTGLQGTRAYSQFLESGAALMNKQEDLEKQEHLCKYIGLVVVGFIFFVAIFCLSGFFRNKFLVEEGGHKEHAGIWKWDTGNGWQKHSEKVCHELDKAKEDGNEKCAVKTSDGEIQVHIGNMQQRKLGKAGAEHGEWVRVEHEAPVTHVHWTHEIREAEQEAMALVLGFLTQQAVVYLITQKAHIPIHGLEEKQPVSHVLCMAGFAVGFFVVLSVVSYLKRAKNRSLFNGRGWLAMSMAWLFERSGEWIMRQFFQPAMARLWSAFTMSGVAICCIVVVDYFADGSKDRKKRKEMTKKVKLEELVALDIYDERLIHAALRKEAAHVEEQSDAEALTNPAEQPEDEPILGIEVTKLKEFHEALRDDTGTDLSVQNLIAGFSVLVGLVWDQAFESAEHLIVSPVREEDKAKELWMTSVLSEHPVIAKFFLAACLIAVVLPGWVMYIVPPARKAWRHHLEDIRMAERQAPSEHGIAPGD